MNAYFVNPRYPLKLGFFQNGGPAVVDPLEPGPGFGIDKDMIGSPSYYCSAAKELINGRHLQFCHFEGYVPI